VQPSEQRAAGPAGPPRRRRTAPRPPRRRMLYSRPPTSASRPPGGHAPASRPEMPRDLQLVRPPRRASGAPRGACHQVAAVPRPTCQRLFTARLARCGRGVAAGRRCPGRQRAGQSDPPVTRDPRPAGRRRRRRIRNARRRRLDAPRAPARSVSGHEPLASCPYRADLLLVRHRHHERRAATRAVWPGRRALRRR